MLKISRKWGSVFIFTLAFFSSSLVFAEGTSSEAGIVDPDIAATRAPNGGIRSSEMDDIRNCHAWTNCNNGSQISCSASGTLRCTWNYVAGVSVTCVGYGTDGSVETAEYYCD